MAIKFEKMSHTYSENTPLAYKALVNVDLELADGKMSAIIGATGSGKSTLIQHLNALLLPTSGQLTVNDWKIVANEKPKNLKALRKQVGLVFQFPEYQLFEETVEKDIAFGPMNFGKSLEEASAIARTCLRLVGLDESYLSRSPLELSGGQKRRVAIAGILAIEPDILVLDEPTAGLDPKGARELMALFVALNKEYNKTIILVTHDLEQVVNYCDEVVVIADGKILNKHKMEDLFSDDQLLNDYQIDPPPIIKFQQDLMKKGIKLPARYFRLKDLALAISKGVKR